MAYTLKEQLANKDKIKKMELKKILQKYGRNDLLYEEIKRRAKINEQEVIDFFNRDGYIGNYENDLIEISEILDKSPLEILQLDCFIEIPDVIAVKYLTDDVSWLSKDNIVKKVTKHFLTETLIKNNNVYQFPNLLEKLDYFNLIRILIEENINYDRIPNIIKLIKELDSFNIKEILKKLLIQNNLKLLSEIINFNKIKIYEITEILNQLSINDLIILLDDLSDNILDQLIDYGYFQNLFEKNLNEEEKLNILQSSFCKKINNKLIYSLLLTLSKDNCFNLLIKNNEFYDKLKLYIEVNKSTQEYFRNNIERYIEYLNDSHFIYEIIKQNFQSIKDEKIINKIFDYFFSDKDKLYDFMNKSYLSDIINTNFTIIQYICSNKYNLNVEQQEILYENIIRKKNTLSFDELCLIFDKYKYIKDKIIKSAYFYSYDPKSTVLFKLIIRYPEMIEIMDYDFLTNNDPNFLMKIFNSYPELEYIFMNDERFLNFITSDETSILNFISLINKYNITNEITQRYNKLFKLIQKIRPELSWGNSTLRPEIFDEKFINTVGLNYIDALLSFDTNAIDIVINLYKNGNVNNLIKWLDYLQDNVSKNYRMIHYDILAYDKMQELANDLMNRKEPLNDYQKQLLEEIIDNNNLYNIKSLDELNDYFTIKANILLANSGNLKNDWSAIIRELFFNESSLKNGVPWNLFFGVYQSNLNYIKYKYCDKGIITKEEYEYLEKVLLLESFDINRLYELVSEYGNKKVPTARMIINKIYKANNNEFKEKLIDLNELRTNASTSDRGALVYTEIKDGVEYIYLNGCDFKSVVHTIYSKKGSNIDPTLASNFGATGFLEYEILSESIKDDKGLSDLTSKKIGEILLENPEYWNLIEGISTISSGINSSRHIHEGYGWGKNSEIKIFETSTGDARISHQLRNLSPNSYNWRTFCNKETVYNNKRGELAFDRFDDNNDNLIPEFIVSQQQNVEEYVKAAKYFKCPIIIPNGNIYTNEYQNKLDLIARKKYLETFEADYILDIMYNFNNNDTEEKIDFILGSLKNAHEMGNITLEEYLQKLIDIKWKIYETEYSEYCQIVEDIINELNYENITSAKRGFVNILPIIIIILFTILFLTLIANN